MAKLCCLCGDRTTNYKPLVGRQRTEQFLFVLQLLREKLKIENLADLQSGYLCDWCFKKLRFAQAAKVCKEKKKAQRESKRQREDSKETDDTFAQEKPGQHEIEMEIEGVDLTEQQEEAVEPDLHVSQNVEDKKTINDVIDIPEAQVESETVANVPRESETIPHVPRESETVAHIPRESETVPHVPRESETVPHVPRESETIPHAPREGETIPRGKAPSSHRQRLPCMELARREDAKASASETQHSSQTQPKITTPAPFLVKQIGKKYVLIAPRKSITASVPQIANTIRPVQVAQTSQTLPSFIPNGIMVQSASRPNGVTSSIRRGTSQPHQVPVMVKFLGNNVPQGYHHQVSPPVAKVFHVAANANGNSEARELSTTIVESQGCTNYRTTTQHPQLNLMANNQGTDRLIANLNKAAHGLKHIDMGISQQSNKTVPVTHHIQVQSTEKCPKMPRNHPLNSPSFGTPSRLKTQDSLNAEFLASQRRQYLADKADLLLTALKERQERITERKQQRYMPAINHVPGLPHNPIENSSDDVVVIDVTPSPVKAATALQQLSLRQFLNLQQLTRTHFTERNALTVEDKTSQSVSAVVAHNLNKSTDDRLQLTAAKWIDVSSGMILKGKNMERQSSNKTVSPVLSRNNNTNLHVGQASIFSSRSSENDPIPKRNLGIASASARSEPLQQSTRTESPDEDTRQLVDFMEALSNNETQNGASYSASTSHSTDLTSSNSLNYIDLTMSCDKPASDSLDKCANDAHNEDTSISLLDDFVVLDCDKLTNETSLDKHDKHDKHANDTYDEATSTSLIDDFSSACFDVEDMPLELF